MFSLNNDKEGPEDKRERLRQEEMKRNPAGSIHGGGLQDLVGGLGWKGTALLFGVLIVGMMIYLYFFN